MRNLRVLFFSANFGAGHIRAAEAVIDAIRDKEPNIDIIHLDFGAFLNEAFNTVLKHTYINIIKYSPKIWGKFYYSTSNISQHSSLQRFINKLGRSRLLECINQLQPDLIVTTYPTVAGVLGQLRINQVLDVPLVTIVTDYVVHSQWIHQGVDLYIVGSPDVFKGFVARGIDPRRIKVTGIPVSSKFEKCVDRREIRAQLKLSPDRTTFLIMGGAYGVLGGAKEICKILADAPVPVQSIFVCGKDKKLYRSIGNIVKKARNPILRFGYANNVHELMSASDVIITKAGGLTVTEALTKLLPLLIFKPIPGQEELNTIFLEKIGAGKSADNLEELKESIYHLLLNPIELEKMRQAAADALPGRAAERTVEYILQLLGVEKEKAEKIG